MCIMMCADHGPCVSGAHNSIVTARAGKDLVSSLVSGEFVYPCQLLLCIELLLLSCFYKKSILQTLTLHVPDYNNLLFAPGLLTIGPRFGGAIDDAARYFKDAHDRNLTPYEFVESMKKKGIRVPGIGHRWAPILNHQFP